MFPLYNLDKIKFATDGPTFERAIGLYENKKIKEFKEDFHGYSAIVLGTQPYRVFVSNKQYDRGVCECYVGQNNTLCKHMVAVAIYAIMKGKPIKQEDKKLINGPECSNRSGELNKEELNVIKKSITNAMKYIKPYTGPSKTWFANQDSLSEGCNRLSAIVSDLPVSQQTTKLLINMLLRLDKKLCTGGVDDSNGIVGGFIEETVIVIEQYIKLDPSCIKALKMLCSQSTCFGWEESLVRIFNKADY
ncbi:hypothetical protein KKA23_03450 [Patescibacteria group bacterium]|nr:hypothetical protein [Patescibacteria group bacterium]